MDTERQPRTRAAQLERSAAAPIASGVPRWLRRAALFAPVALSAPALALGFAGLAGKGPPLLRRRPLLAGLVTGLGVAGLLKWQLDRFFTETPEYELEGRIGPMEIRRYAPRVIAETVVDAGFEGSLNEGFRRLASYIFGGNHPRATLARVPARRTAEQIPMTAPVTSAATGGGIAVSFTMPRSRDLGSLPRPDDPRVRLRRAPGERVAALRFRGRYDAEIVARKQGELLRLVREAGLEPRGAPVFAGYDPPSTIPLLRRVEVWVALA